MEEERIDFSRIPHNITIGNFDYLIHSILEFISTEKSLYTLNSFDIKERLLMKQNNIYDIFELKEDNKVVTAHLGRYRLIYFQENKSLYARQSIITPFTNNGEDNDWKVTFLIDTNITKDEYLVRFIAKIIRIEMAYIIYSKCGENIIYDYGSHGFKFIKYLDKIGKYNISSLYIIALIFREYFSNLELSLEITHDTLIPELSCITNNLYIIEDLYKTYKESNSVDKMTERLYLHNI